MSDELHLGPTVLAPGAPAHPDGLARFLLVPLAVALVLLILVFYVIFDRTRVVGESMLPNLLPEDRLLVTKGYEDPRRGDIVIIDTTRFAEDDEEIVKRVVGIPGDHISVADDVAAINGSVEDTSSIMLLVGRGDYFREAVVPSGTVYVMGDNRRVSLDSRYIGAIPLGDIQGRVVGIYAPITRITSLR